MVEIISKPQSVGKEETMKNATAIDSNRRQSSAIGREQSNAIDCYRSLSKLMALALAAVAMAGHAGDSAPFLLDTAEGMRIAHESEPIAYSPHWSGAAGCSVAVDGDCLLSNATEEGSLCNPRQHVQHR